MAPHETQIEAWTLTFDNSDENHCVDIDTAASDLPDATRALLGPTLEKHLADADVYEVRDLVRTALSTLEDQREDTLDDDKLDRAIEDLEAMADSIKEHGYCQCGLDAWMDEQSYFNEQLAAIADEWAVFHIDGPPAKDIPDATVSNLWGSIGNRDGWNSVKLTWNPDIRELTFTFGASPSNFHGVARPLTGEQERLTEQLRELDSYLEHAEHAVVTTDPAAVKVLLALWGDPDGENVQDLSHVHTEDVLEALTAVNDKVKDLDELTRAMLPVLAENWTSTLDELITTTTIVVADPVAA